MLTIVALVVAVLFLPSPWNVIVVVAAAIVDLAETGALVRWSRRGRGLDPTGGGVESIVGRAGVALDRLDPGSSKPVGQVRVEGEIWSARSAVAVERGAAVVVTAVDGLLLEVEPPPPR